MVRVTLLPSACLLASRERGPYHRCWTNGMNLPVDDNTIRVSCLRTGVRDVIQLNFCLATFFTVYADTLPPLFSFLFVWMDSLSLVVFLRGWFSIKQRPRSMPRALKKCIIVKGHLFLCIHIKVMVPCNDGAFQHLSHDIAAIRSTKYSLTNEFRLQEIELPCLYAWKVVRSPSPPNPA